MNKILLIGGFDPFCKAGLPIDLHTVYSAAFQAVAAVTVLTVQNDEKFDSCTAVDPQLVFDQIRMVCQSIKAIKIGVLGTFDVADAVFSAIRNFMPGIPVTLDPVFFSTSGGTLSDDSVIKFLKNNLSSIDLLTPNVFELEMITGQSDRNSAMEFLIEHGCKSIFAKGFLEDDLLLGDYFLDSSGDSMTLMHKKVPTSMRGTGCILSTKAAIEIAKGHSVKKACHIATDHVVNLLRKIEKGD